MSRIKVDTSKVIGTMKPMHGGGQPPLGGKGNVGLMHYLTEAGIPYSRLHDVSGPYGGSRYVDIPNIFPDFDADVEDPNSYDFTFTDYLIKALVNAGVEPYYRLGITIEALSWLKSYRTTPPKDFGKWARICEHIIAHYTDGWANGFRYKITYWEIWCEPDNVFCKNAPQMWSGTAEEYYRFYDVTAKHLKARFPNIKVGGYSSCGFFELTYKNVREQLAETYRYFMDFFHGFLKYVREHSSPFDFFSWHSYEDTKTTLVWEKYVSEQLKEYGFGKVEIHLNEWNPFFGEFGTEHHSAEAAAMMLAMQNRSPALLCIYDMRASYVPYCPLFDVISKEPIHTYYSLVAFNRLYKLGDQVELTSDTENMYAVAASDGKYHALMISNITGAVQPLELEGVDLSHAHVYIIDDKHLLSWAPGANTIANNTVMLIEWQK